MKKKLLCILHRSPPFHGAAKVGDFIGESKKLGEEFDCRFITIKSSDTIGDIGKVNVKKFYLVAELFVKVMVALVVFRPHKIYFTASISSVAFYRDLLVSILWKFYALFRSVDVYYHYHTKGIDSFVSSSARNLKLTNFFVKNVTMVLLSPLLEKDLEKVNTYKNVVFLPNGVEDSYDEQSFRKYIENKSFEAINVLYLSNMIKEKGYFEVLKLASSCKDKNYHFHFAGGWKSADDEKEFFDFVRENELESTVTFHGFVNGAQKKELFEKSQILIFPTRYKLESFGLVIIEAFSYGVPVLSTDEGSIPFIIDEKSGVVIDDVEKLSAAFSEALTRFINAGTAKYCRKRYLENFSLEQFEENLVGVFR